MVVARNNILMASVNMVINAFGGYCRIMIMHSTIIGISVTYTWITPSGDIRQVIQNVNVNDGVLVFSSGGEPITFTEDSIRIPAQYKRYITKVDNGTVAA